MTDIRIENININIEKTLISPSQLKKTFPLTERAVQTVLEGQTSIKNILNKKDDRLLVVVGPCSIHDIKAAKEYANKIKNLADELKDTLCIVMRVYFEKPRTTTGWQGLITDPYLDESFETEDGLRLARELLVYIAELGVPAAGEALDIVTPQYIQDLFSWTAIGARTTESQSHRKMASGLTAAVGFKNGTDGDINIALNAMESVAAPHTFVSINPEGRVADIHTMGNPNTHLILRGGKTPNFDKTSISKYEKMMEKRGMKPRIMVDCSHANSGKKADNQPKVLKEVAKQINAGNQSILGVMLESHLHSGNQAIPSDLKELKYGVSITDACIDWNTTERVLREFAASIQLVRNSR